MLFTERKKRYYNIFKCYLCCDFQARGKMYALHSPSYDILIQAHKYINMAKLSLKRNWQLDAFKTDLKYLYLL